MARGGGGGGGGSGGRLHTMSPDTADLLRRMGMDELYNKFKQLDEAAVLVTEGKLKREVYESLVQNVEASLQVARSGKNVKKQQKGVFDRLAELMPAKEAPAKETRAKDTRAKEAPKQGVITGTDKPIISGPLYKRGRERLMGGGNWRRRWVVLYPRAILIFKNKTDRIAKETVILTPEFFVSTTNVGSTANGEATGNGDDESVLTEETMRQNNKKDMEFVFLLSDLENKQYFAAKTEEERTLWVHTITTTIRAIYDEEDYFDTPQLIDAPKRNPAQIQEDYEKRKEAYLRSRRKKTLEKSKRRTFYSRGPKHMTERDVEEEERRWAEEGDEVARMEMARKLLKEERENVRRLEEEQRRREEELENVRRFAEEWKEKAEANKKKFEEAETRAEHAIEQEKRLEAQLALMNQMRAQNIEKEEALKAEHDTTAAQLQNMQEKRRMSHHPAQLAQYEAQIKALEAKLAALQSALNVDLDGLDWDGSLEDAEAKMKLVVPRLLSDNQAEAMDAQAEFDQWDKIIRNHADYKKREENKWIDWENENRPKNEAALEEMRSLVPPEVLTGISEDFLKRRGLRPITAKRIMTTKILQFLWMDKDTIAKIHIADLNSRYIPQGLDIVETRAIYTRLPSEFQNDRDGSKKSWLETFRSKLHGLTEKEKKGQLTRPEERHPAYRNPAENKAASAAAAGKKKKKKKKPAVAKKVDTSALNALFAGGAPGGPPGAKKGPPIPGAGGPPPHVLAMMQRGAAGDGNSDAAASSKTGSRRTLQRKSLGRSLRDTGSNFFTSIKSLMGVNPDEEAVELAGDADESRMRRARNRTLRKKKEERLLAEGVREQLDNVRDEFGDLDDFDEKDAPAFDFGGDYSSGTLRKQTLSRLRAGEFSKGIEDGILNLCKVLEEKGRLDKAEGGIATMTFGQLFEEYESISDMLVGLLMRAKKRKLIKYHGDMLFQGIHNSVKITLLVNPSAIS